MASVIGAAPAQVPVHVPIMQVPVELTAEQLNKIGSVNGQQVHLIYPDKPGCDVFMLTPNPDGYTQQRGEYGTRPGTIIPHVATKRSFEHLQKPKHSVPMSVVRVGDEGIQTIVPSIQTGDITDEIARKASEQAKTMTDNPVDQGVAMYELIRQQIAGAGTPEVAVPQVQQVTPPATPPPPGATVQPDMNALLQLLAPAMFQQLAQQQAAAQAAAQSAQPAPPPNPLAPAAPQFPAPQPTVKVNANNPLDALQIDGLSETAKRPTAQVNFDFGELGIQSAYYHWATQQGNGLYLIFDTRYDYPVYLPPNLGATRPVVVELANLKGGPAKVPCLSVGFTFMFGVFRIVILVITGEQTQ